MRIFIFENGLNKVPTEYSQYLVYPYCAEYSHDTALGAASVTLRNMERADTFAPGTVVMIGDGDWRDNTLDQWVIVDTNRATNHASGKHSHTLYLCDITKQLEREIVGSKTFTRSLIKSAEFNELDVSVGYIDTSEDYAGKNTTANVFHVYTGAGSVSPTFSPIIFPQFDAIFDTVPDLSNTDIDYIKTLEKSIYINGKKYQSWTFNNYTGESTTVDMNGNATIEKITCAEWFLLGGSRYHISAKEGGVVELRYVLDAVQNKRTASLFLYLIGSSTNDHLPTSLSDACSILCKIARDGETVEIRPVGGVAVKAMAQEIVDIDLAGKTLREALDTVAGVGGCFCRYRLEYAQYKGGFDHVVLVYPISSITVADLTSLGSPISHKMADSIEGSCASMDSTVSNLVCESDSGTVAEPTSNAWKSLRAEEVRVTEDSCRIEVSNPIYSIEKLQVLYGSYTANITKYLYEQTAYDMLSSYAPVYPKSKAYALKYKRGDRYIDGLSFEVEDAVSNILKSPSIVNICNAEFGTSFSDLGISGSGTLQYPNLRFRVTYTPQISTRVKQTKPDTADNTTINSIFYNQSESYVDAKRYGRNIAGAAERGGQPGKTLIYKSKVGASIPAPGTLHPKDPAYTISKVIVERGKDVQTVQLDLARYFNRLNPFIGIDSGPRLFEISEHEYADRDVMIEDYCIIGAPAPNGAHGMITDQGLNGFANSITMAEADGLSDPEIALATGISNGEQLNTCILPVASFGLGRSLVFTFGYKDNYSAGDCVSVMSAAGAKYSLKEAVPYADVFGEFDTADLKLYGRKGTEGIDPDSFPAYNEGDIGRGNVIFDSEQLQSGVQVYKDSRERIKYTYQIHFVTNAGWILSPGMAEDFRMISRRSLTQNQKVRLYRLSYELSRVDTTIDLSKATVERYTIYSGAVGYIPLTVHSNDGNIRIDPVVFGTYADRNHFRGDGKAWAVAYEDGKLLFGNNEAIDSGTQLPDITFSFRHRVE